MNAVRYGRLVAATAAIAIFDSVDALADTGTTSGSTPVGGGLIVGLAIAYLARRREIGGWLLYYYMQLYLSVVVSAILFAVSIGSLSPDGWDSSARYVLYLISTLPVWLVLFAEAVLATYLLFRKTEVNVRRLRIVGLREVVWVI